MKKVLFVLMISLIITCFSEGNSFGKVNFLQGKAYYTLPKSDERFELTLDKQIPMDATIETDISSRLEIKTKDNHFVRLWEKTIISCFSVSASDVKTPERTKVVISVKVGKIWNNFLKDATASNYEVSTPGGVCGVRGTIYNTAVDDDENIDIMVFDGAVAVYPVYDDIVNTFQKTFDKPYRIEKPFQRIKKPFHRVTKEEWESIIRSMQMISISSTGEKSVRDFSLEEFETEEFFIWNNERDENIER